MHHAFRLIDRESGRTLDGTLEIHTLELGRYNLLESELSTASMLDCWLYWLLHAHEYEPEELLTLFPQNAIRQATQTITQIAFATEDKAMYDAREKAIRDHQSAINASFREGEAKGEVKGRIVTLQEVLSVPVSSRAELDSLSLDELQSLISNLQAKLRNRFSS